MESGITPSQLGKVLIENWYQSAQDDVLLLGKIVTLESKVSDLEHQITDIKSKEAMLDKYREELSTLKSYLDDGREVGKRFKLLQYLNQRIIFYNYDEAVIRQKHGDVVEKLGDGFNLTEQIAKIKKINKMVV